MKIKHDNIEIPDNNPFANCQLDRKKYADILTNIIETYSEGFVLAIDNKWGTGKTTFVKMWERQLHLNEFNTLYLNAWENDFDDKPLLAILSCLKELINDNNEANEIFKDVLDRVSIFTNKILPIAIKAIAKKMGADELLQDILEGGAAGATEVLKKEVEIYSNKKESLSKFRTKLEEYIIKVKGDKPIVFIIDELDRCRPNYAVQVLEQIKHFFNVPGIVFILAIDKEQLGHAIRGVYGSDLINADEYLNRFIDLYYQIPLPETKKYVEYLYNLYELDKFINSNIRKNYSVFERDKRTLIEFAADLFMKINLPLRLQHYIFRNLKIILSTFKPNQYIFSEVTLTLIYLRINNLDVFNNIVKKVYSTQELLNTISEILPKTDSEKDGTTYVWLEARIASLYNYSLPHNKQVALLIRKADSNDIQSGLKSKIDNNIRNFAFISALTRIDEERETHNASIDFILPKIQLLENLIK